MRVTRWMPLMAATVLVACGGDGNGSTGPGNGASRTFSATVSGDVQTTVRGEALFGLGEHPDYGSVFAVEMNEGGTGAGALIQLVRIGSTVPAAGSYNLADGFGGTPGEGDFVALAMDSDESGPVAVFVGTAGTIHVTSSSANGFKGTFTFDAAGGLFSSPDDTLHITVSGSFNAAPATQAIRAIPGTIRRSR